VRPCSLPPCDEPRVVVVVVVFADGPCDVLRVDGPCEEVVTVEGPCDVERVAGPCEVVLVDGPCDVECVVVAVGAV
jgi:hypothetical protein